MPKKNSNVLTQLEDTLELYFLKKAPRMPQDIRELFVNLGPWILLILIILSLPGLFAAFGIGAILSPLSFVAGARSGITFGISWILLAVVLALEGYAIPGLFKKELKSWKLLYYAALIGAVQTIISFNIAGFIVGTAISMYILFQIKGHYK